MKARWLLVVTLAGLAGQARADEPPEVPVTQVVLKEVPDVAKTGKLAVYSGQADDKGVAFYIDGLSINTPVGIVVRAGDPAAPMRLSVKNDLSRDWDRHVAAENGIASTKFRTEGPAMALVQGPTGEQKPYKILIWVGPEIRFDKLLPPPFMAQAAYDKKHPEGSSKPGGGTTGALIAVIVVVALIAVGFVVVRRKKGAAR
jgi:hypothetical protein